MRSALIELRNSAEAWCSPLLFYRPNRERYTTRDYLLFLLGLCDQIAKNKSGLSQQTLCPRSGALTFCIIRIESNNKELQQWSCRQWIDCARGVVTACGNSLFIRQKIGMQLCTYIIWWTQDIGQLLLLVGRTALYRSCWDCNRPTGFPWKTNFQRSKLWPLERKSISLCCRNCCWARYIVVVLGLLNSCTTSSFFPRYISLHCHHIGHTFWATVDGVKSKSLPYDAFYVKGSFYFLLYERNVRTHCFIDSFFYNYVFNDVYTVYNKKNICFLPGKYIKKQNFLICGTWHLLRSATQNFLMILQRKHKPSSFSYSRNYFIGQL